MSLPDPTRSRAVLIGVDSYRHLDDLPAVSNNLKRLAALLRKPEVWGLPKDHCVLLHNPPSSERVLDAVHEAASEAREAFVVYFAGHGLLSQNLELQLALSGSEPGRRMYRGISYDALRSEVLECRAWSKVVILDCCNSGNALAGMGTQDTVADQTAVDGTYVITASPKGKPAMAPVGEKFTTFTGELVKAIDEGVPDADSLLDMESLFQHVRHELIARGLPKPQKRAGNDGHRITLFRNRWAGRPRPAPDTGPRGGSLRTVPRSGVTAGSGALAGVTSFRADDGSLRREDLQQDRKPEAPSDIAQRSPRRGLAAWIEKPVGTAVLGGGVILLLAGLLVAAMLMPGKSYGDLRYQGGDKPKGDEGGCYGISYGGGTGEQCHKATWAWQLPPGKSIRATFRFESPKSDRDLVGKIQLKDSCGAAVEWSLSADSTRVAADDRTIEDTPVEHSAPLPEKTKQVVLAARRVDTDSCTATLEWKGVYLDP
ncbi:caspase domain-containing protein [Streptomyces sp. BBFR25]|uniref:caspase domain-containing protein n=1 Tax=Streptomyces sp. BBFR25 TaxID=3372855 RepID=UPI0037DCD590